MDYNGAKKRKYNVTLEEYSADNVLKKEKVETMAIEVQIVKSW